MRSGVVGVVLAAGSGSRMGMPKARVTGTDGRSWVAAAAGAVRDGGCEPVVVVIGAEAELVRPLVPGFATVVVAPDWAEGMGASLRAGLRAVTAAAPGAIAALIHLVDVPDVGSAVIERMVTYAAPDGLARATYAGRAGHPVLIGRTHWDAVTDAAVGDQGARSYLAGRQVTAVECGDLASGIDVDHPTLTPGQRPR